MCSPAAWVAGIGAAAGIAQNREQLRQAGTHAGRVSDANARLINEQSFASQEQLRELQKQEHEATSLQVQELQRRADAARATAITSAAETGTTGLSVDALNADFTRQELDSTRNLFRTQEFRDQQHEATAARLRTGQQVALLDNQPAPFRLPGFLGAALRIGVDSFTANEAAKARNSLSSNTGAP